MNSEKIIVVFSRQGSMCNYFVREHICGVEKLTNKMLFFYMQTSILLNYSF